MIKANIVGVDTAVLTTKKFETAFNFLKKINDVDRLEPGTITLDNGVKVMIQSYETSNEEVLDFETHDRYYDIQYLVKGVEDIHLVDREDLEVKVHYDSEADITFYHQPKYWDVVRFKEGDFVVIGTDLGHKPRVAREGSAPVMKIVIKVPADA